MDRTYASATLELASDPDSLVPEQWSERLRPPASSELRLMAAVLLDAIRDYRMHGPGRPVHARYLAQLAKQWIDRRDHSWPYSFESICGAFDIDPVALRQRLTRERTADLPMPAPSRTRRNLVLTGAPSRRGRRPRRDGCDGRDDAAMSARAVA